MIDILTAATVRWSVSALFVGVVAAQAPPTAASVTEQTRTLAHALDTVLAARADQADSSQRSVLFVVDPTTSVAESGFAKELAAAIKRGGAELANVRVALIVPGDKPRKVALTADHQQVVAELSAALATPDDQPRNLFAVLRDAAPTLGKAGGPRRLLLVTFDNGDFEDDVEGTGRLLAQRRIETHVLTSEAFLADCSRSRTNYADSWSIPGQTETPAGCSAVGGDAPLIDVPFGFVLQAVAGNTITASGYAPYALSRLVQLSGGRVHLYTGPVNYEHCCILYGICPDCGVSLGWPDVVKCDHRDHAEDYRGARLQQVAPLLGSRSEAAKHLAQDAAARATFVAWRSGYDAGLICGKPSLRVRGLQVLSEVETDDGESRSYDKLIDEIMDVRPLRDPKQAAQRARAAADEVLRIETELKKALDAVADYHPRELGIGRYTQAMLLLTRVSLLSLERFCIEDLPSQLDKEAKSDRKDAYLVSWPRSICHGMGYYVRHEAKPGVLRDELVRLDAQLAEFERSFAGSPIYFALRRMSYPQFALVLAQSTHDGNAPRPKPD